MMKTTKTLCILNAYDTQFAHIECMQKTDSRCLTDPRSLIVDRRPSLQSRHSVNHLNPLAWTLLLQAIVFIILTTVEFIHLAREPRDDALTVCNYAVLLNYLVHWVRLNFRTECNFLSICIT